MNKQNEVTNKEFVIRFVFKWYPYLIDYIWYLYDSEVKYSTYISAYHEKKKGQIDVWAFKMTDQKTNQPPGVTYKSN